MAGEGWRVQKFGGTSLVNAERFRRAADLVRSAGIGPRAVIVSAVGGVTDGLIALLDGARSGPEVWAAGLEELRARHTEIAAELLPLARQEPFQRALDRDLDDLERLLHSARLVQAIPEETLEVVAGFGELWSAPLLTETLRERGEDAAFLDAREVLVVGHGETGPLVDWERSAERFAGWRRDHPEQLLVITGFVASTAEGRPTNLRRNGSDYSASIFAALLEAESLTIWTDVDGVMSADPRRVPEAFVLPELSAQEAIELAYFGASVLHPDTMAPAVRAGIPIQLRNSLNLEAPGTRIVATPDATADAGQPPPAHSVRGFSTVDGLTLINLEGTGMIGVPGISERLFGALGRVGVSVVMISQASSEHSICFAVPEAQTARARDAIEEAFHLQLRHGQVQEVQLTPGCTILAAVGDAMASTPGVSGTLFGALGAAGVNVRAVAQGASEHNITVVIDQADADRALRAVHAGFYLSPQTLSVGVVGCGGVGAALLDQLRERADWLRERFRIDLRVRALSRTRKMLLDETRVGLDGWAARLDGEGVPADLDEFTRHLCSDSIPHTAIIDCTSSKDVADRYGDWLHRGVHVITPNKKANSASQEGYEALRDEARQGHSHYLYEATVGAGLPVVTTLRDLVQTGDQVRCIEGVLSGTLSYLFNGFDGETPFSTLVREARAAGYTEPDPRDDLSGMDVARKLIILAREMGRSVELEEVRVENLVPEGFRDRGSIDEFLDALAAADDGMAARCRDAASRGTVLRYVGRVEAEGTPSVELCEVPADHAFAALQGADNCVRFTTLRYADRPLVVQGPGAGPEVTAGGVFADLLRLASYLGAPS